MSSGHIRSLPLLIILGLVAPTGHTAEMGWPEAVATLTSQRSKADTCVALLKRYGDTSQMAQGQLDYTNAKIEMDAVIAGLLAALAEGGTPDSLPTLQTHVQLGSAGLVHFCGTVSELLPVPAGQRGILDEIVKAAIEPVVKALSDGIAALYNNHRRDDELTRLTIRTQLEAAKWPDFAQVKAAP
jgi:hypothetical protein